MAAADPGLPDRRDSKIRILLRRAGKDASAGAGALMIVPISFDGIFVPYYAPSKGGGGANRPWESAASVAVARAFRRWFEGAPVLANL